MVKKCRNCLAQIFDKSKLLGMRLHPQLLHHWYPCWLSLRFLSHYRAKWRSGTNEQSRGSCSTDSVCGWWGCWPWKEKLRPVSNCE